MDLTPNKEPVNSIGTIAFLGAKKRKTSAYASFLIHRTRVDAQAATATRLKAVTDSLLVDDERTEAILRQHARLTKEQWSYLDHHDLTLSAKDAITVGLADGLGDFVPPPATQIFTI